MGEFVNAHENGHEFRIQDVTGWVIGSGGPSIPNKVVKKWLVKLGCQVSGKKHKIVK